jgi:hypothetical protein
MRHKFSLYVGCLATCSSSLSKRVWKHRRTAFLVVLLEYRVSDFQGNDLDEDIVLEIRTFFGVKTQDLQSGDDNACVFFSF